MKTTKTSKKWIIPRESHLGEKLNGMKCSTCNLISACETKIDGYHGKLVCDNWDRKKTNEHMGI